MNQKESEFGLTTFTFRSVITGREKMPLMSTPHATIYSLVKQQWV